MAPQREKEEKEGVEGSFGLFSPRVQVEQLGGSLNVNSEGRSGAKVVVTVPTNAVNGNARG